MNKISDLLLVFFLIFVAVAAFGATPEGRAIYQGDHLSAVVAESVHGDLRLLAPKPETRASDILTVSGETKKKSYPIVVEIKDEQTGEVLMSGTAQTKDSLFGEYKSWQKVFSLRSLTPNTRILISVSFVGDKSEPSESVSVPIVVSN